MSLPLAGPGTYQYLRPRNGRDVTLPRPPRRMPRASDVCRPGTADSAFPGERRSPEASGSAGWATAQAAAPAGSATGMGPAPLGPPASVASASVSSRGAAELADDGTTTGLMRRRTAPIFEQDDEPTDVVARRLWQPPPAPEVAERRAGWFLPVGFASLMAAILVLVALLVR